MMMILATPDRRRSEYDSVSDDDSASEHDSVSEVDSVIEHSNVSLGSQVLKLSWPCAFDWGYPAASTFPGCAETPANENRWALSTPTHFMNHAQAAEPIGRLSEQAQTPCPMSCCGKSYFPTPRPSRTSYFVEASPPCSFVILHLCMSLLNN
jgi:hypothetical protein